jgi:methylase of polypeptide subunit release factors
MALNPSEPHPVRHLLPRSGRDADFAAVRLMLAQCGFTAEGICARLQLPVMSEYRSIRQGRQAVHAAEDALDALILLLMDGEYVERAALERLLPPGAVPLMESLGVTASEPGRPDLSYGALTIFPVDGMLLANDRATAPDGSPFNLAPDAVYPAATANTLQFLDAMPRHACDAFLDIGTGTGVAALAAARFAGHAWGTDIAARSVLFAEFNRRLNGIGNATMLEGDLYQPVEGLTFDCIVSHPPYVPARENKMVFRDGGEDGEQILRGIVEGLPRFLRPGGRFFAMVTAADCEGEAFEDRLRRWLGQAHSEFDLALASYTLTAPADAAASALLKRATPVDEILYRQDLWKRRQVRFLFYGAVTLKRHPAPRPAFTTRVQTGEGFSRGHIDWLLEWGEEAHDPERSQAILDLRPVLSPHAELAVFHRVEDGRFAAQALSLRARRPFDVECTVPPWLAQVVSGCNGETTWRQHFERAQRAGVFEDGATPEEFIGVLEPLVSNGLLWLPERPLPR